VECRRGGGRREAKRNETVDLSGKKNADDDSAMSLETGDLLADRPSQGSLSDVIDDLGDGQTGDDSDMPADRTRIEANPLEMVQAMDVPSKTPIPG